MNRIEFSWPKGVKKGKGVVLYDFSIYTNGVNITTHRLTLILCQIPFTNLLSCVLLKEPCGIFEVANIALVCQAFFHQSELCQVFPFDCWSLHGLTFMLLGVNRADKREMSPPGGRRHCPRRPAPLPLWWRRTLHRPSEEHKSEERENLKKFISHTSKAYSLQHSDRSSLGRHYRGPTRGERYYRSDIVSRILA